MILIKNSTDRFNKKLFFLQKIVCKFKEAGKFSINQISKNEICSLKMQKTNG